MLATAEGAGSKALLSDGDMSITGGKVKAFTTGDALYEADINEVSSSAALRSKGTLTIKNATLGLKSTGAGAKGINNVGAVAIENSQLTVVASGATYTAHGTTRSRGVDTDSSLKLNGGTLLVRSYDNPVTVGTTFTFANSAVYAGYQVVK